MGQLQGEPIILKVWREEERVMGRLENGGSWILGETGEQKEEELMLTGFFISQCTLVFETSLAIMINDGQ